MSKLLFHIARTLWRKDSCISLFNNLLIERISNVRSISLYNVLNSALFGKIKVIMLVVFKDFKELFRSHKIINDNDIFGDLTNLLIRLIHAIDNIISISSHGSKQSMRIFLCKQFLRGSIPKLVQFLGISLLILMSDFHQFLIVGCLFIKIV